MKIIGSSTNIAVTNIMGETKIQECYLWVDWVVELVFFWAYVIVWRCFKGVFTNLCILLYTGVGTFLFNVFFIPIEKK